MPELTLPPAEYRLRGSVPRSSGFGSSAALCVNLARYLYGLCRKAGIDLSNFRIQSPIHEEQTELSLVWPLANALEGFFHGSPSGIDTGLACRRGLYAFFPGTQKLPDPIPIRNSTLQMWILIGAVPRDGTTKELIGRVRQGMVENQAGIVSAIEHLGEYSRSAIHLLMNNETSQLRDGELIAELMLKAQEELGRLGLNHPAMDEIFKEALRRGALGGKLSGAGCGGAFYLLCRNESSAQEIQGQLRHWCQKKNIVLSSNLEIKLVDGI